MIILVCSKISIPAKDRTLPAWKFLRSIGHTVHVEHPRSPKITQHPDVIISMGVTIMEETFEAVRRFPDAKLFCYNWDCYEWVWKNPRPGEYDYKRYGELLSKAAEIWVPSECTGKRTTQWWGLENWHTVLSACPYWDYGGVRDGGYALCTLRQIPDPQWDWFERACDELSIPWKMTKHECSYQQYQEAVAHCSFLVSHCYELSTGGLTLMEGYYLGKPCLLSSSPWHGGRDYMGNRARYFQYNDFEDFKVCLQWMWDKTDVMNTSRSEQQRYITDNFSDQRMVDDMLTRMERHHGV